VDSSEAKRSGEDTPEDPRHHHDIDWVAAERSPEFQELIAKKRSFVLPALGFVFIWYFGFILLAGYAPDFMGERITGGFTIGYALALSQFVMTWVLAAMYLRRADRNFDPLARKAAEVAVRAGSRRGREESASGGQPGGFTEPGGAGRAGRTTTSREAPR